MKQVFFVGQTEIKDETSLREQLSKNVNIPLLLQRVLLEHKKWHAQQPAQR